MKYGISKKHMAEIKKVLGRYPNVERGVLFGRRAVGDYVRYSDIEIALEGKKAGFDDASSIQYYLEEATSIPYPFDIVEPERVESEDLADEIKEEGVVIYEKKPRPRRALKPARGNLLGKAANRKKQKSRSRVQVPAQARAR